MIVYFADRQLNIIGQASTGLPRGLAVLEDMRTDEIETGIVTFEGRIAWNDDTRSLAESCVVAGNYVLRYDTDDGGELFTITNAERDTKARECFFYAEDAGLSLLNEIAISWPDGRDPGQSAPAMTLTQYVNMWLADTGFEIGNNAALHDSTTKEPGSLSSANTEQTVSERLLSLAADFGYEVDYSYKVDENSFNVSKMLVNIYKKRGQDDGVKLELDRDVDKIVTTESIENLATSLLATGGEDAQGNIVTLKGYSYHSDDDDFVVGAQYFASRKATGYCLQSPSALAQWGRVLSGQAHHITKVFSDTGCGTQESLAIKAAEELKKCCSPEVNYEVDIAKLPEGTRAGDYIYIVDEKAEFYLKARVLKLEESVSSGSAVATLGEYLIQSGGISQKVRDLAAQFQEIANIRQFYTWIVYADDEEGTNISLTRQATSMYLGVAANMAGEEPVLTDPTIYNWTVLEGGNAFNVEITSSAGTYFVDSYVDTTLTAHIYVAGIEVTSAAEIARLGVVNWYRDGVFVSTGLTLTIAAGQSIVAGRYEAKLETEEVSE